MVNIKSVLEELFSGYSFRSKVENDPIGNIGVIQMKDLENDYTRINLNLIKVDSSSIPPKYLLQTGDVLFISKGSNNHAVTFNLENQRVVAASAFFVLRPDQTKVVPEYLTWYLNQQTVQQYIKDNRAGTYIPNVNRDTVEGINVQLPDLKIQKLISQITTLSLKEQQLLGQLKKSRIALVNTLLTESLNN